MSDNLRFKKNLIETNDPLTEILYQIRMGSATTNTTVLSSVLSSILLAAKHNDGEFGFEFDVYDSQGTNDAYLNYLTRYNSTQNVNSINIITIKDTELPNPQIIIKASKLEVDSISTGAAIGGGGADFSFISTQSLSTNRLSSGIAYLTNATILSLSTNTISSGTISAQRIENVQSADITSLSTTNISSGFAMFGSIETNAIKTDQVIASTSLASTINTNFLSSADITVSSMTGVLSSVQISAKQRINQTLLYSSVSGFYGLDSKKTPLPNPLQNLAVTELNVRTSPDQVQYQDVAYSPSLRRFVAIASSGTASQRVATSDDGGVTWTRRTAANANNWVSVVWAAELNLFVAVSATASVNSVMTSNDGITWTQRTTPNQSYNCVCWAPEIRLFVATAISGTGQRVMTSPDGVTWTAQNTPADNSWGAVCWSPEQGKFVAVSSNGTTRIMTSFNGVNWILAPAPQNNEYQAICWSPERGVFFAVASFFSRGAYSFDGFTWVNITTIQSYNYFGCEWVPEWGLFVAVGSQSSVIPRMVTSPDLITWTIRGATGFTGSAAYRGIAYSPEFGTLALTNIDATANNEKFVTSAIFGRVPSAFNVFNSPYNSINSNGDWTINRLRNSTVATSTLTVGNAVSALGQYAYTDSNNSVYAFFSTNVERGTIRYIDSQNTISLLNTANGSVAIGAYNGLTSNALYRLLSTGSVLTTGASSITSMTNYISFSTGSSFTELKTNGETMISSLSTILRANNSVTIDAPLIVFPNASLVTNTAGAASGNYLSITVNGVAYKLNLLNP